MGATRLSGQHFSGGGVGCVGFCRRQLMRARARQRARCRRYRRSHEQQQAREAGAPRRRDGATSPSAERGPRRTVLGAFAGFAGSYGRHVLGRLAHGTQLHTRTRARRGARRVSAAPRTKAEPPPLGAVAVAPRQPRRR